MARSARAEGATKGSYVEGLNAVETPRTLEVDVKSLTFRFGLSSLDDATGSCLKEIDLRRRASSCSAKACCDGLSLTSLSAVSLVRICGSKTP